MHGIGVSGGIAIGYAQLVSHATLEVAHYALPERHIPEELARFDRAIAAVRADLQNLRTNIPATAPAEFDAFLGMHLMILNDSSLSKTPKQLIASQQCNAEWALKQQMDSLLEQFEQMEDSYLRERKTDVVQVIERVLKALMGYPSHAPESLSQEQSSILVAHDLSPADMILYKRHHYAGFITDVGGATSHTAILARSLNIPCVVALHGARELIHEQETIIVDGSLGVVIVNPSKQALAEYKLRQNEWEIERQKLKRLKSAVSRTLDGTPIELLANIELPDDIPEVKANGAAGVGLFRTEFLFLNRNDLPGEEEQFLAYRKVAESMRGLPVIIRTLDLGADKNISEFERNAANPALGLRAVRLCLAEPQLFHTQLRALLRASAYGDIKLLIPMLSSLLELDQVMSQIKRAQESLNEQKTAFNPRLEIGGMIEIPAAALSVQAFARRLDFLSIGTNDLIQYTLAIDRTDDSVAHLYNPLHPAVLQLILHTIRKATRAKVPVAVCGEMAGDANLTRLLLGLGLRQFSMHPAHLLSVKQKVLKTNLSDLRPIVNKILKANDAEKIHSLLSKLNA